MGTGRDHRDRMSVAALAAGTDDGSTGEQPESCACTADSAGTWFRRRWGPGALGPAAAASTMLRRYSTFPAARPACRTTPPPGGR
ncbi:hypothetical protein GA0115234_1147110 [Streptomyces sp. DvalAA-43]|nr:hypothetical protein GA0115234_1147110 [Streptomyces sp. DvalAA-43]